MAAPLRPPSPVVRWALYLFVLSLPFEYPKRTIPWEVTTITCAIFLLAAATQPQVTLRRLPWAARWFAGYLYAYLAAFALSSREYPDEVFKLFILLLEAVLFLWAAHNVLRDRTVAKGALIALGIACVARAGIQLAGIATTSVAEWGGGERISALGQNSNHSAVVLSAGVLALIGLAYGRERDTWRLPVATWPLVGIVALAIVQNGSRGGTIALVVGLMALMLGGRTVWTRIRNAAAVLLALGFLVWASYQSEAMRNRFRESATTGFMAGRERIYPRAWQMFVERPLSGWGPVNNQYHLGSRVLEHHHERTDTHNLVLEIVTATGLLGLIPFAMGTLLCLRAAWRARRGREGIVPFALLGVLLTANMSGNWIAAPLFWLTLAYALAADDPPAVVANGRMRRSRVTTVPFAPRGSTRNALPQRELV